MCENQLPDMHSLLIYIFRDAVAKRSGLNIERIAVLWAASLSLTSQKSL